jgi:manganese oxidase
MGGGEGPFGSIFMGGMFTILKIREGLKSYDEDPGWYEHPAGTVATPAGERQAVAPTTVLPRRPGRPVPGGERTFDAVKPSGGHGGSHRR